MTRIDIKVERATVPVFPGVGPGHRLTAATRAVKINVIAVGHFTKQPLQAGVGMTHPVGQIIPFTFFESVLPVPTRFG